MARNQKEPPASSILLFPSEKIGCFPAEEANGRGKKPFKVLLTKLWVEHNPFLPLCRQPQRFGAIGWEGVTAGSCHHCHRVFPSLPSIQRAARNSQAGLGSCGAGNTFKCEMWEDILKQRAQERIRALPAPCPACAGTKGHKIKSFRFPNSAEPKQEIRWITSWHIHLSPPPLVFPFLP